MSDARPPEPKVTRSNRVWRATEKAQNKVVLSESPSPLGDAETAQNDLRRYKNSTAPRLLYELRGAPQVPLAEACPEQPCWVCAAPAACGVQVDRWMGSNFTGQNKVRSPESTHVCAACVYVMAGRPPDTFRLTSHLFELGGEYLTPNKGDKPAIRRFLRRQHLGPWFAAIADSGQKHIVPWTPINGPG